MSTTYSPPLQTILDSEVEPVSGVRGEQVEYTVDGVPCTGYRATPIAVDDVSELPKPGVLVVHDWLGVTDVTRMRCDMLARLGYTAFAADVYGTGLRPTNEQAAQVAGGFYRDPDLFRARLAGAHARLLEDPQVDSGRTAVIGYCFGGAGALQLARTGADLRAVVTFHGGLSTGPEGEAGRIRAKILILTGGSDPVVPDADVAALEDELRGQPALDWQVVTYSGAMHAFTVPFANAPDQGALYDPRADRRSWQAMKVFLEEAFA